MNVIYRPLLPDHDIPRMAEILNAYSPGSASAEQLAMNEARRPQDWLLCRPSAVDETGRLLGWAVAAYSPVAAEGRWLLRVTVDPACEGHGIGGRLYEEALRFAGANGATRLDSDVKETAPRGLRFAEARGFRVDRHLFESVLDVATFAEAPHADKAGVAGVRYTSLAQLGDNPENMRRYYDLEVRLNADVPGFDTQGWEIPYEHYCQMLFNEPWYRPDGLLLAVDGDQWVGMASLRLDERGIYHNMTGVVASHRGRGIATGLKLQAIRWARSMGVTEMRTDNDSENGAMLAINRKLGYVPRPGVYKLIKDL